MSRIIAIDPGTTKTGYVVMEGLHIVGFGIENNHDMLDGLRGFKDHTLVYEMIAAMGMPVGAEVFETCVWIGRFIERFGRVTSPVFRRDVKHHLCNSAKAKDSNIRQAILDKYPATGGGKTPQIGTKKQPGPLFGVTSHIWSAIGVGLTFQGL